MTNQTLKEKSVTVEELLEGAKKNRKISRTRSTRSREKCNDIRKCCEPH